MVRCQINDNPGRYSAYAESNELSGYCWKSGVVQIRWFR